jgi:hypothetical protein
MNRSFHRAGILTGLLFALVAAAPSGPLGTEKPLLCSIAEVAECDGVAECSDATPEQLDLPPLWRVDFAGKQLATTDGKRSSPITALEALETVLVMQGHEGGRGWTLVVERATGHLSGSIADAEGAFVLAGSCTAG